MPLRAVSCVVTVLLLLARGAGAQVPAGPEFPVNTYTTGGQNTPLGRAVAVAPNGDFVVTWQHRPGPPGVSYDIYGQRFDAAGTRQGAMFRVNTFTEYQQLVPAAAADGRGRFIVVWASSPLAGPSFIGAQRFDPDGQPRGGEIDVSAGLRATSNKTPAVAADRQGNFVVVWPGLAADGSGWGISARLFDPSGSARGRAFQVNSYATGNQDRPVVAMDDDGGFVVAWSSAGQDGSDYGVFAQRFDRFGALRGSEFSVNTYTTDRQAYPSVAAHGPGGFLVVWQSRGQDGSADGIFARRFEEDGAPAGGEFQVNTSTSSVQQRPTVTAEAAGTSTVTWMDFSQPSVRILGRRYGRDGQPRGGEFQVASGVTAAGPSIASDIAGNFVATWPAADGDQHGIFGRRYGGLRPRALEVDPVDAGGNGVLEPGEAALVRPSWLNDSTVTQSFSSTVVFTGPPGPVYAVPDGAASYGPVADGGLATCGPDCVVVAVTGARPVKHWDAVLIEEVQPTAQGQAQRWTVHVGETFLDVPPSSPFYEPVEAIVHHGVTTGCSARLFCPLLPTPRDQTAVLTLAASEGTAYVPPPCGASPMFPDVPPSNPFCPWVEEVGRRGVAGCGGGNYCPQAPVTREEMAIFALATLEGPTYQPPPCGTPMYGDVPASSPFCPWIEELTRRSAVTGCGGGLYCPTVPVTREQMSMVLAKAFGLELYGV